MHELQNHGGAQCQNVYGGNIDRAVGNLLLESINPMTVDAAVSIQHEMSERKEEILQLYGQQMERARYEMELAKRRYLRVDPDNRLVASELEYDWNQKINEYESAKGTVAWLIQKYGLSKRKSVAVSGGWMTGRELMAEFGINEHNLRRMRESGELEFKECHTNGVTYLYKPGQDLPAYRQKKPPLGDVGMPC